LKTFVNDVMFLSFEKLTLHTMHKSLRILYAAMPRRSAA